MASSVTSGEALDLNLHPVVWKALLGNEISFYEYEKRAHVELKDMTDLLK